MNHTRPTIATTACVVALALLPTPASATAPTGPERRDRTTHVAQFYIDRGSMVCAVSADSAERRGARHPGDICHV